MSNEALQVVLTIIGILGSVGLFAGGLGYLYSKFNKGTTAERTDVLSSADQLTNFWKEQVEGFKLVIEELRKKLEIQTKEFNIQLQAIGNELGQVKGQLEAESSQKKEYLAILQNRDPASKQFMEFMIQAAKDQVESHKLIVDKLVEIHNFAKMEHDRDFKVESTVTKQ